MEWLQSLVDAYKSDLPVLAAFVLGLMTAISPCPLATNITATAYLSKNVGRKHKVLLSGIVYTLGRMFTYTVLGLLFYFGASQFKVTRLIQGIGGLWLGVALVVAGVLMLDVIKFRIPLLDKLAPKVDEEKRKSGYWNAFVMGVAFALAFCPFSGVLYFAVLIPMTLASPAGLLLPPVFSVATGLPVIVISYLLAYSMANIGRFYNSMQSFEKWFKRIVAAVFIVVGVYYIVIYL
jgi:cytochrome c biogenesis protein CcdA